MIARRLALTLLLLCAPATAAPPGETDASASATEPSLVQARRAVGELGLRLKKALLEAMAERGPEGAVSFCHQAAPGIAADVGARNGVHIGRVGTRVRNPANTPAGWRAQALASFQKRVASGEDPRALEFVQVDDTTHTLHYARSIKAEGLCLTCHGANVTNSVRAAIRQHYPWDRATGYRDGELRGAFWVEVPLPAVASPR
jgi:hypothetical protein